MVESHGAQRPRLRRRARAAWSRSVLRPRSQIDRGMGAAAAAAGLRTGMDHLGRQPACARRLWAAVASGAATPLESRRFAAGRLDVCAILRAREIRSIARNRQVLEKSTARPAD